MKANYEEYDATIPFSRESELLVVVKTQNIEFDEGKILKRTSGEGWMYLCDFECSHCLNMGEDEDEPPEPPNLVLSNCWGKITVTADWEEFAEIPDVFDMIEYFKPAIVRRGHYELVLED